MDNGFVTSRNPGDLDAFIGKMLEETRRARMRRSRTSPGDKRRRCFSVVASVLTSMTGGRRSETERRGMGRKMRHGEMDGDSDPQRMKRRPGGGKRVREKRAAVDELRDLAADLEIRGYERMSVDDLIRAIRDDI